MAYIDYTATATTASFAVSATTAVSASRASALTSGSIPDAASSPSTLEPVLIEDSTGKVAKAFNPTTGRGIAFNPSTYEFRVTGDGGLTLSGLTAAGGTLTQGGGTTGSMAWRGPVSLQGQKLTAPVFVVERSGGEIVQPLADFYSGSSSGLPAIRVNNSGSLVLARRNTNAPLHIDNGGGRRPQMSLSASTAPGNAGATKLYAVIEVVTAGSGTICTFELTPA